MDPNFQFAGNDHVHYVTGTLLEFGARVNIVVQTRTRHIKRALLRKLDQIKRRHGATGSTKENQIATRPQHVQIFGKGRCTDTIVDYMHAFATSQSLCFRFKILFAINDDFVGSGFARKFCLAGITCRANDPRS